MGVADAAHVNCDHCEGMGTQGGVAQKENASLTMKRATEGKRVGLGVDNAAMITPREVWSIHCRMSRSQRAEARWCLVAGP